MMKLISRLIGLPAQALSVPYVVIRVILVMLVTVGKGFLGYDGMSCWHITEVRE